MVVILSEYNIDDLCCCYTYLSCVLLNAIGRHAVVALLSTWSSLKVNSVTRADVFVDLNKCNAELAQFRIV